MSMNCAGCHGYDAKGGMGPNLTDTYWRYGGTPERIYESILNGRPKGMPAWGLALPPQHIWQLVAFIQSLGGTVSSGMAQAAAEGNLPDKGQNKGASDQQ
jgi:cytochrome c oxidase cbb3-type subunit 3